MQLIFLFIVGIVIGSFLNVCIYRVPRKISLVSPSSHCPLCKAPVRAIDNIPLASYALLRGRCRSCGAYIHWHYPLVEVLSGILLLLAYMKFGVSFQLFFFYGFMCALLVITFVDLELRIVPDVISLSFMIIGLVGSLFSGLGILHSLLGLVVGGGSLVVVGYVYWKVTGVEGMGGGDVKLAAMIGAFLGWKGTLLVIFLASLGGAALGLMLMIIFRLGRRTPIPFGTFMAPAAMIVLLYGQNLINWYATTIRTGY